MGASFFAPTVLVMERSKLRPSQHNYLELPTCFHDGVVVFGARWCAPFVYLLHQFEPLEEPVFERLSFYDVDTPDGVRLADIFGVKTLPTLLSFKNGVNLRRVTDPFNMATIREELQNIT